jgi:hypothetical protein
VRAGDSDHDMHAAEIYRAIALRFHARYMDARSHAAHRGGDLPDAEPMLNQAQTSDRYQQAAWSCVIESADSAGAALALVEFAAVISADRQGRRCATTPPLARKWTRSIR